MFAVLYRGFVLPGKEQEYKKNWKIVADYFIAERGALGSTLHKTVDGQFLAYSRWPDKSTRDASWGDTITINDTIDNAVTCLKKCIDDSKPHDEIQMEIIDERTIVS
jgi:hypothetical protein